MSINTGDLVASSDDTVSALLTEMADLRRQMATMQQTIDDLQRRETVGATPVADETTVDELNVTSRRRLFALAGGAAAAAVIGANVLGTATPAAANTNDPVLIGQRKFMSAGAYAGTQLDYGLATATAGTNFFTVHDGNQNVDTGSLFPAASAGYAISLVNNGVYGYSQSGGTDSRGVIGRTAITSGGVGVQGSAEGPNGGTGVYGVANITNGVGVSGNAPVNTGTGVLGNSTGGIGVSARSTTGWSLLVDGSGHAQFVAAAPSGPPTTAAYAVGEIVRDVIGDWFVCITAGAPGKWRKLGGTTTAGALHVITPTRVYDSRFPTNGGVLSTGASRVVNIANGIDLGSGAIATANVVPSGATAIAYNITLTQATLGGFLAVTPGDAAEFAASTINWVSGVTDLANGTLVKISAAREVKVFAGGAGSTHFIIDVVGYYL